MRAVSTRERLVHAAFTLFEEKGYDAVTVEEIAQRAQVGRTTLFRLFGSKEELIFPDHDALLARAEERLSLASEEDSKRIAAVVEAAKDVFMYYMKEGELARARFRLTSSAPALRDREIASVGRYIRLFTRYLLPSVPRDSSATLRAELIATAVVTSHNHVLRRWLRGESARPEQELSEAMETTVALFSRSSETRTAVAVFETTETMAVVVPRLKRALTK